MYPLIYMSPPPTEKAGFYTGFLLGGGKTLCEERCIYYVGVHSNYTYVNFIKSNEILLLVGDIYLRWWYRSSFTTSTLWIHIRIYHNTIEREYVIRTSRGWEPLLQSSDTSAVVWGDYTIVTLILSLMFTHKYMYFIWINMQLVLCCMYIRGPHKPQAWHHLHKFALLEKAYSDLNPDVANVHENVHDINPAYIFLIIIHYLGLQSGIRYFNRL